jgi:LysM repeat protein
MSIWGRFIICLFAATALIAGNGCVPSDSSQLDEEKEPHFVLGKSRVNAMDYAGAVEAFNESLEVNPRSAAAHFQLAWLFETKEADPAAAIYHYQEFLRLNPKADNAEVIKQRIYSCKQQLAADVMPLPSAPAAQRQLEDLVEKNRQLQSQVDHLKEVNNQWNSYVANLKANSTAAQAGFNPSSGVGLPLENATTLAGTDTTTTTAGRPVVTQSVRQRTHTVTAGETLASIARKSGVSLTALQAANPSITPKKMRVGQTVTLPAQ